MSSNPFETIDQRLSNIENLLLDIKHSPKEETEKIFSVKELADYAGVSELSIRNYISEGKIQAERIGRKILIRQSQFEKGLEEVKSLKYKR
ncbi:helix-turn-helix domain-containing protein [Flavobacterium granuli]|uniref:Excisionase family DNA binding protein n=1 Tax=Flavobacterium granuli TaxID=280093 RepID=A0ABU1S4H0_9FLAO|nr:helix-turn-helix domain-containing protein [Flavobacterium granuli]MDR6845941.1 excisionase family DNA binding protein [Flavobacterium granuli]